ncbi:MAG: helix-turn-helix domain-containing protein [Chlamydiales bacterium]
MELEGKIYKDGKFWLVEIPGLDAMTQGKTRKDAVAMTKDLVLEMVASYFPDEAATLKITITDYEKNLIGITTSDTKLLLALSLRRQREASGSTLKKAAERLGSKSPNSYAQYEKGETSISIEQFEHLLVAANPHGRRRLRLV